MSCSVHDISDIERRGTPGVFVSTVHFASAVQAQSGSLGFDAAAVLTRHPIQDRTDDEMAAIADAAFDELVKALVGPARGGAHAQATSATAVVLA